MVGFLQRPITVLLLVPHYIPFCQNELHIFLLLILKAFKIKLQGFFTPIALLHPAR